MKQSLADEELDRELALSGNGKSMYAAVKMRVGPKVIVFETKDTGNYQCHIRFVKERREGQAFLAIQASERRIEVRREIEKCDHGHYHTVERTYRDDHHFADVTLSWSLVENLIEWLETGEWRKKKSEAEEHESE